MEPSILHDSIHEMESEGFWLDDANMSVDGFCDSPSVEEFAAPNFVKFNPGIEASSSTAGQPCEPAFLEALLEDLDHLVSLALAEIFDATANDATPPHEVNSTVNQLRAVMHQCRRLKASPSLFPSSLLKDEFLSKLAHLSTLLRDVEQSTADRHSREEDILKPIDEGQLISLNSAAVGRIAPGIVSISKLPDFFPDKAGGKKPWNNWLDNSAQAAPGWIAIQQKIPKIGDSLMRREIYRCQAHEMHHRLRGLRIRNLLNDPTDLPAPGENFKHMRWSGFCTVPQYYPGFKVGTRKHYDSQGVVTIEYLSRVASRHQYVRRRMRRHLDRSGQQNCPYFRFAMAYDTRAAA